MPAEHGGATRFPRIANADGVLEVAPVQGRLLLFQNLREGTLAKEPDALHAGLPMRNATATAADEAESGGPQVEKWVANCWFRGEAWEKPLGYYPARPPGWVLPADREALGLPSTEL